MTAMTPLPQDHPLMRAWEAYKLTEEYTNSKHWAPSHQHIQGALWAVFSAGWEAKTKSPESLRGAQTQYNLEPNMKSWKPAVAVFILVELVIAALAWIGGFNFDRRGSDVAFTSAIAIWLGAFFAGFTRL